MEKIARLEAKKMLKEIEYLKSDFEYKNEIVSVADDDFMRSVSDFLESQPDLKELYDESISKRIDRTISMRISESSSVDHGEVSSVEVSDKVKRLYREIAKRTHPDKISDVRLNSVYIDASRSYSSNNVMEIYSICDSIGIEYDVDDSDLEMMKGEIDDMRRKISFLESTSSWAWKSTDDSEFKKSMILNHIRNQIR